MHKKMDAQDFPLTMAFVIMYKTIHRIKLTHSIYVCAHKMNVTSTLNRKKDTFLHKRQRSRLSVDCYAYTCYHAHIMRWWVGMTVQFMPYECFRILQNRKMTPNHWWQKNSNIEHWQMQSSIDSLTWRQQLTFFSSSRCDAIVSTIQHLWLNWE